MTTTLANAHEITKAHKLLYSQKIDVIGPAKFTFQAIYLDISALRRTVCVLCSRNWHTSAAKIVRKKIATSPRQATARINHRML